MSRFVFMHYSRKLKPLIKTYQRHIPVLLLAAMILLAPLLIANKPVVASPEPQPHAAPVSACPVLEENWENTIKLSGSVIPHHEAIIGTEINSLRAIEVKAEVGDRVEKGQTLVVFDSALLNLEANELRATLTAAQSRDRQAQTNKDRALKLKNTGAMSEQAIADYIAAADDAHAKVGEVRARLDLKEMQIGHAVVAAPAAGIISAKSVALGTVKNYGEELFRIIVDGRLDWRGDVSADQMSFIQSGQKVDLYVNHQTQGHAQIRTLYPSLDQHTHLGTLLADIEPADGIHAGLYAEGTIIGNPTPVLTVPMHSIVTRDGKTYIFVPEKKDGVLRATAKEVSVGRTRGDRATVKGSLAPKDVIVCDGAGFIDNNDAIQIVSQEGAPR